MFDASLNLVFENYSVNSLKNENSSKIEMCKMELCWSSNIEAQNFEIYDIVLHIVIYRI